MKKDIEEMKLWNKVKTPPGEALKGIRGGRLKGFTDIDPMWRMEIMTKTFGPVGIGWTYEILKQWTETPTDNNTLTEPLDICVFTNIQLKYKVGSDWSEWIPGTGGHKLAVKESRGIHISDECYKMSLTDALSVAMKAIGVGADVYMGKLSHDGVVASPQSKYSAPQADGGEREKMREKMLVCPECKKESVIVGKKEWGGGYVCWKKSDAGGCGVKFKTLDEVTNPGGKRIADLVESISRAEVKFKKAGHGDEFKKVLDEFKVDHADEITDEETANKALLKLSTKYKLLKIEENIPVVEEAGEVMENLPV